MATQNDLVILDSASQLPSARAFRGKSEIAKYFRSLTTATPQVRFRSVGARVSSAARLTRGAAEAGMVGSGLAYLHVNLPTGLDMGGVALDAAAGALFGLTSVAFPNSRYVDDMHNNAQSCASVYSFRKVYDFLAQKKLAKGKVPGGSFGPTQTSRVAGESSDPIVEAAKNL